MCLAELSVHVADQLFSNTLNILMYEGKYSHPGKKYQKTPTRFKYRNNFQSASHLII